MNKDQEFVKNVRFRLGMTVAEFARKIEVETKYIYRWEHEGVIPSGIMILRILRLCKKQGIKLDDLVFLFCVICGILLLILICYNDSRKLEVIIMDNIKECSNINLGNDYTINNLSVIGINEVIESLDKTKSISTGYKTLDFTIDELKNGELYVIAGKAVSGKTNLLNNILYNIVSKNTINALYFSFVDCPNLIVKKLVSIDTDIPGMYINFKDLKDGTVEEKLKKSLEIFSSKKIHFSIQYDINKMFEIANEIKPDIILIDGFQCLTIEEENLKSRLKQLQECSYKIKMIAKTLNVPVVITTNISRKLKDKNFESYCLFNLYEAGFLTNEIASAIFCMRDKNTGKLKLKVINGRGLDATLLQYEMNTNTMKITENIKKNYY